MIVDRLKNEIPKILIIQNEATFGPSAPAREVSFSAIGRTDLVTPG